MKKEIQSIKILAETGALFFIGYDSTLKDTGGVRFVYDQKNDAELIRSLFATIDRKMHELFYDGIIAKIDVPLGDPSDCKETLKKLEKSHVLVDLLKTSMDNKNTLNINFVGKKVDIVSKENESNFVYGKPSEGGITLMGEVVSFVDAMRVSKNKQIHSKTISEISKHIDKISSKKNPVA